MSQLLHPLCDEPAAAGLDGIYMTNTVQPDSDPAPIDQLSTTPTNSARLCTKITHDKGVTWHALQAPMKDSRGMPYKCTRLNSCHLHLFFKGNPQGFSSVYSTRSAVGLIMAVGVVGDSLDEQTPNSEVATFMSRDAGAPQMVAESLHMIGTAVCDGGEVGGGAGRSWIEVDKGSSVYAFSNHGGLMIRAAQFAATSEVTGQSAGAPAAACMHRHSCCCHCCQCIATSAAATAPLLPLHRHCCCCHCTTAATAPPLPLHRCHCTATATTPLPLHRCCHCITPTTTP